MSMSFESAVPAGESLYTIQLADLDHDKHHLLGLWQRNFAGIPEARFPWIYTSNPYGRAVTWLAKAPQSDRVVGATSLFPRAMLVGGTLRRAAIAGDFAVDKEQRGFGPALALQRAAVAACDAGRFDFLYGFPNQQSEAVVLRAGYRVVGQAVRFTKPLRAGYYLKRSLSPSGLARVLAFPADLLLRLTSPETRYRRPAGLEGRALLKFEEQVHDLWSRAVSRLAVAGEREPAYLSWRYLCSPHRQYFVLALVRLATQDLAGYIVWYAAQNRVNVADLLTVDDKEALDCLLSEFLVLQHRRGTDAVSILCLGCPALIRALKRFGFSEREREISIVAYAPPHSPLAGTLFNQDNWYMLEGDNDI